MSRWPEEAGTSSSSGGGGAGFIYVGLLSGRPAASVSLNKAAALITDFEGGRIDVCNGTSWVQGAATVSGYPALHSDGHVPGGIDAHHIQYATRSADLSLTGATASTPVDDAQLFLTMPAIAGNIPQTWIWDCVLFYSGDQDLGVSFTVPTGSTGKWGFDSGLDTTSTTANNQTGTPPILKNRVAAYGQTPGVGTIGTTTTLVARMYGMVHFPASIGGTLQCAWTAGTTVGGSTTTVYADSWLVGWRMKDG